MIDDAALARLAKAGLWAPTAENRHMVLMRRAGPSRVVLEPLPAFFDEPRTRWPLHCLGVGAVVENIAVQAAAEGLEARVAWSADPAPGDAIASIDFVRGSASALASLAELAPAIGERVTNRAPRYRGTPFDEVQRARFGVLLDDLGGLRVHWLSSGQQRRSFERTAHAAESIRFSQRVLHAELFAGIRWEAGWNRSVSEGLPPGALGIEWVARPGFRALSKWPLARFLSLLGGDWLVGLRAAWLPLRLSPDLMVISNASGSLPAWLDGGRAMQRCWLLATVMGRCAQPIAAVALYAQPDFPGVPNRVRERLARDWLALIGDRVPMIGLRIGLAPAPPVRALRGAVERFIGAERSAVDEAKRPAQ